MDFLFPDKSLLTEPFFKSFNQAFELHKVVFVVLTLLKR